jgi:hypothetical protein
VRDVRRLMRGSLDDELLRHRVFAATEQPAWLTSTAPHHVSPRRTQEGQGAAGLPKPAEPHTGPRTGPHTGPRTGGPHTKKRAMTPLPYELLQAVKPPAPAAEPASVEDGHQDQRSRKRGRVHDESSSGDECGSGGGGGADKKGHVEDPHENKRDMESSEDDDSDPDFEPTMHSRSGVTRAANTATDPTRPQTRASCPVARSRTRSQNAGRPGPRARACRRNTSKSPSSQEQSRPRARSRAHNSSRRSAGKGPQDGGQPPPQPRPRGRRARGRSQTLSPSGQ